MKADTKRVEGVEEFWYNGAWYLKGFDFQDFSRLLEKGKIKVDTRIGRYPDGSLHDHGTGFRVFPDDLDLCLIWSLEPGISSYIKA